MKNIMMRMMTYRNALSLMLMVLTAFSVPHMAMATQHQQNQEKAWTNMGGLGVVEDGYQGVVRLAGTRAYLTPGAAFGKLYYNVTATDGLFIGPNKTLVVRFYKPDNFSLVRASLVSVDVATGARTQVHFFSSSQYPASVGSFQTQQSVPRNLPEDFDFNAKAYYIEVDLVRLRDASGTPQGDPRIELLQILSQ